MYPTTRIIGLCLCIVLLAAVGPALASSSAENAPAATGPSLHSGTTIDSVVEVQKYNRAIHIMAMLLVGFGFLMVFVRGYGLSALTATYLLVAISIPLYIWLKNIGASANRARASTA